MLEEKTLSKTVTSKVVEAIEFLDKDYPEDCNNELEFLKRFINVLFILYVTKGMETGGFVDRYNVEGVVASNMKKINPDLYAELYFLRERGIL